jgi:hypothetical protein
MNPFELSDNAVVLNRRNAQSLYEAMSRLLTHKLIRFTCNASVADDTGQSGHANCVLAVLRYQHAIEIIGVDGVTYRIPFGARVEVGETELHIEMHSLIHRRPNFAHIRWLFVVQDDADYTAPSNSTPPCQPLRKIAWPTHEEDWLRMAPTMQFEMEVAA